MSDDAPFAKGRWRGCTDILCLILFIVSMTGLSVLASVAVSRDPHLLTDLIYPTDSYGNNCGRPGTATASMPKVFYPTLDADISSQLQYVATGMWWMFNPTKLCATACPSGFSLGSPVFYGGASYPVSTNTTAVGAWYSFKTQDVVNRCFPQDTSSSVINTELCSIPSCTNSSLNTTLGGTVSCYSVASQPDAQNVWEMCAVGTSDSVCTAQRAACELAVTQERVDTFVPTAQSSETETYTREFASWVELVLSAFASILDSEGYSVILIMGFALPVALGWTWALLLWLLAGTFVILAILLLVAIEITLCIWLAFQAGWFDSTSIDLTSVFNSSLTQTASDALKTWYSVCAVVAIILTLWHIIGLVLARTAIIRLIAILRETSKVHKKMVLILLWPIFSVILQLLIFTGGLLAFYFMVYSYVGRDDIDNWVGLAICALEVLGVLWALETVKAVFWTSMSAAIAIWYVKDSASGGFGGGCGRLCACTGKILGRHLGSMCFGALIIAFFKALRLTANLMSYTLRDRIKANFLLTLLFKCVNCFLWCIEKTVEYISYWGFVFVAVHGTSFCRSCFDAFGFQVKYLSQSIVNKSVQIVLKLVMKISITITCTLSAFFYLDGRTQFKAQYDPLWVSIVVFFYSYIIASAFTLVFDVSIDTIYLCAFEDMERVKANSGAQLYMSDSLRTAFGIDNAEEEAGAAGKVAAERRKAAERRQMRGVKV
ncbi:hypothetical protein AB1Y20_019817 [Prymnesium parvum]|uniref:Choline transporter-like protein n=1 Tax=Prymnesium parvum TaxID=97485 RepID=A0AB34JW69_PRYPA